MELRDYLAVLRKYWRSVTAVTLLGVLAAAAFSMLTKPTYTAKAALFFSISGASSVADLANGSNYAQRQVASYVQVATSPAVLQPVITDLQLAESPASLAERVTVTVPTNTSIINIAVADTDPERAASVAQGIGDKLVTIVKILSPENDAGRKNVEATVIAPAAAPTSATTPKIPQNLALGLLVGLCVGVGQALLRETLDTRVRSAADVAAVTDVPVVGRIAFERDLVGHYGIAADQGTLRAEAFRRLRTNLQYLDAGEGRRSFVITSSIPGEGKSSTSIDAAATLSAAGLRVLLIDADLRKPSVGRMLGLEDAVGLSTLLIGQAELGDVIQPTAWAGLDVVASGPVPPNPSELLGSAAMPRLLELASQTYDAVVIDAPPLLPVTDAAILSRITSGALLVIGSGEIRAAQLGESLESLDSVDGRVLGVVLNKLHEGNAGYGGYYRRYEQRADERPQQLPRRAARVDGQLDRPRVTA